MKKYLFLVLLLPLMGAGCAYSTSDTPTTDDIMTACGDFRTVDGFHPGTDLYFACLDTSDDTCYYALSNSQVTEGCNSGDPDIYPYGNGECDSRTVTTYSEDGEVIAENVDLSEAFCEQTGQDDFEEKTGL